LTASFGVQKEQEFIIDKLAKRFQLCSDCGT